MQLLGFNLSSLPSHTQPPLHMCCRGWWWWTSSAGCPLQSGSENTHAVATCNSNLRIQPECYLAANVLCCHKISGLVPCLTGPVFCSHSSHQQQWHSYYSYRQPMWLPGYSLLQVKDCTKAIINNFNLSWFHYNYGCVYIMHVDITKKKVVLQEANPGMQLACTHERLWVVTEWGN